MLADKQRMDNGAKYESSHFTASSLLCSSVEFNEHISLKIQSTLNCFVLEYCAVSLRQKPPGLKGEADADVS